MAHSTVGRPRWWSRNYAGSEIIAWCRSVFERHGMAVTVGLGVFCQALQALYLRGPWMDEASLEANIVGTAPTDFFAALRSAQLAPPGYLFAERFLASWLHPSLTLLRLPSFLAGVTALVATAQVAQRLLDRRAALMTVAVLSLCGPMIYYASELKPYSCDAAAAALIALACIREDETLQKAHATESKTVFGMSRPLFWGGLVLPWFSFGVVFLLVGLGLLALWEFCVRPSRTGLARVLCMGIGWGGSVTAVYAWSMSVQSEQRALTVFWTFAFVPWPVRTLEDAQFWVRTLPSLIVNPLGYAWPDFWRLGFLPVTNLDKPMETQGLPCGAWTPLALAAAGLMHWLRVQPRTALRLVVLPVIVALIASAAQRYPLHGRLAFHLLPCLALCIGFGFQSVVNHPLFQSRSPRTRRRLGWLLTASLLAWPLINAAQLLVIGPMHEHHIPAGDLKLTQSQPQSVPIAHAPNPRGQNRPGVLQ